MTAFFKELLEANIELDIVNKNHIPLILKVVTIKDEDNDEEHEQLFVYYNEDDEDVESLLLGQFPLGTYEKSLKIFKEIDYVKRCYKCLEIFTYGKKLDTCLKCLFKQTRVVMLSKPEDLEKCIICDDKNLKIDILNMSCCRKRLCRDCINHLIEDESKCPFCRKIDWFVD